MARIIIAPQDMPIGVITGLVRRGLLRYDAAAEKRVSARYQDRLPLAEAIRRLSVQRPELGLVEDHGGSLAPIADIAQPHGDALDRWLADTTTLAPGMDARTAAAYLLSIFLWRFGQILGALYLSGAALPVFTANDVAADMTATGEGRSRDIRFRYRLTGTGPVLSGNQAGMTRSIVDVHRPLVDALHDRTRLSKSALWRLVTDGVAEGFLDHGRATGEEQRAQLEALSVLAEPPLHNPQWRFVQIDVGGKRRRWFRLRGGCCRMYLMPATDYCTTCVVRPADQQIARLRAFVERRPS